MKDNELLLIDLSSLAHPIWHMAGSEPDPNYVSTQVVARVRALATEHPHAAICCDSGKSFRCDIDPTYKAQRPEPLAPLQHQITLAREILERDGFPVWAAKGYEADDLIATATKRALAIEDTTVLIASADKDLLALVGPRVTAKSLTNGTLYDEAAVREKFKVAPAQMTDYLCLVGDASDNIKGAAGIGGVRAAAILGKYGSLEGVYAAFDRGATPDITPAQRTALQEFRQRWPIVRQLVEMKTDAPIPFESIAAERVPTDTASAADMYEEAIAQMETIEQTKPAEVVGGNAGGAQPAEQQPSALPTAAPPALTGMVLSSAAPAPAEWDRQLEPRSLDEAAKLAGHMFKARLFSAYGTWEGVFSTILAGRELGMPAMASLRAFHIIENRPQLSADSIAALVLRSGKARYFRCTQRTDTAATFVTHRIGDGEEPFSLTYTIAEAKLAWKKDQKAWDASGWGKNPADMLVARAKSKLARLVYPDVVAGLYAPEEME